ncbi:MAG: porin family protein [Candidatus Aminicenantales bacterium]
MKKLTAALVIGAFACLLALPGPAAANVQFGLKGGGNMAKITGADAQDINTTLKNKVGFVAGVFVAFNMGSVFTLQVEALYTMKGVDMEVTNVDPTVSNKLSANYLEIPLLLKFRIPTPLVSPFVFAGPAVGFKLSEKLNVDGQDVPLGQAIFKNNDYGAIFGGGLNIGSHFQIDVRYSMGLQKVVNPDPPGTTPLDVKNGVWSATVGIAF